MKSTKAEVGGIRTRGQANELAKLDKERSEKFKAAFKDATAEYAERKRPAAAVVANVVLKHGLSPLSANKLTPRRVKDNVRGGRAGKSPQNPGPKGVAQGLKPILELAATQVGLSHMRGEEMGITDVVKDMRASMDGTRLALFLPPEMGPS